MADDLENALKELLKNALREVAGELIVELKAIAPIQSSQPSAEVGFLLTPRETAKRLAISERHLFQLTHSGQLPSVRVGKCVRYSIETIRKWVRQAESNEQPLRTERTVSQQQSNSEAKSSPRHRRKRPANQKRHGHAKDKTPAPERRSPVAGKRVSHTKRQEVKNEEQITPFSVLLSELGVEKSRLPPITNGDLMRIAQVDIVTLHGWMYLNRSLPEEATNRLIDHFRRFASEPPAEE